MRPRRGDSQYESAIERALNTFQRRQALLEREQSEAPALLHRLATLIPERRQFLLNNSQRFQTWELLKLLIRKGREETFTDPYRAEEILQLAAGISGKLSSACEPAMVEDLKARTWGYIANARRARMDLQASEEAFEEAFVHLGRGTEEPVERAVLFDLQASLRRVQQRFEESLQLLRRALSVFRRIGDTHRVGSAIVKSSITYRFMDDHEQAIVLSYQSLDLIDPDREPRLALCAFHNLADDLTTAGRFPEAWKVLRRAHRLYLQFPDPQVQSRRQWVEAKVAYGLGRPGADALVREAQESFKSKNKSYDVDLISRDLASLRAGHDRLP
jgi:tetratricopeptide (TPR) repeat protein